MVPHADQPDPAIKFSQEVRFAVVMYGGVSLAIYMNGVAQEMLRLVRATAPAAKGSGEVKLRGAELSGTERIYRKLGQMLRRGGPPRSLPELERGDAEIQTRFVVDVISGTSAGGINGVFLAKALANDESIGQLTGLWVEEGDFGRLLNDKKGPSPAARRKMHSLLDSKHMYRELLKALEGMDTSAAAASGPSPYVEELDLFVTATDISGLTLPIQLADGVVKERRHRNVFHFVYTTDEASGEDINDFERANNPFLAFAARSTSSFPFAFEPMKLTDIDDVLATEEPYRSMSENERKGYLSGSDRWKVFYQDYVRAQPDSGRDRSETDFAARAFSDGGALDNKPFSYATDALLRRRADLPVERKLVFVDPDPQNPDKDPYLDRDIDVLENTRAALSPTVSTETIREDIQRILERNRLIQRVKHIADDIERDVAMWEGEKPAGPKPGDVWAAQGLSEMINSKGIAYGGYHRLKVSVLTDELASYVTNAANFETDSDEFAAVRYFVRVWRDLTYDKDGLSGSPKPTQNQFLMDFDLGYRLRRLNFIRAKINELSGLEPPQLFATLEQARALAAGTVPLPQTRASRAEFRERFQSTLRRMLRELGEPQKIMLRLRRKYSVRGAKNPLSEHFKIQPQTLEYVLNQPTDDRRYEAATVIMLENEEAALKKFITVAEGLGADFKDTTVRASSLCAGALSPGRMLSSTPVELTARALLWHYYQGYEDYDLVIFPVTHQTGVGETVPVDVIRVSPYDSTNLIDQKLEDQKPAGRHKLGGTTLGHFGAFLDKSWRKNDIMWGRLDAAERIISTLLPDGHPDAATLIDEAHLTILREEMLPGGAAELRALFVGALAEASAGVANAEAIRRVREQFAASPPNNPTLKSVLDSCVEPEGLLRYFKDEDGMGGYEVSRGLDPESMVKLMARASTIFGRMLETLAEKHGAERKHAAWVTRLAQVFWGFVEVAVPRTLPNLLARHFIKLLYLFSGLMIAGGVLLVYGEMLRFGLLALAITGVTHAAVKDLGDYMRGGRFRRLKAAAVVFVLALAVPLVVSAILGFQRLWAAASSSYEWFIGLPPVAMIGRIEPPLLRALAFLSIPVLLVALVAVLAGALKQLGGGGAAKRPSS